MRLLQSFLARLWNFVACRRGDNRLREEMESHLAMQTEENIRAGLSPEEAGRQAQIKLGAAEAIREAYHAEEGLPFLENLLRDFRHSIRALRRSPGFTSVALATLALGIGSSAAIFCLMDAIWLHPIQGPHPDRIVRVFSTTKQEQEGEFNYSEYQAFAQRMTAFKGRGAGLVAIGGRGSIRPRPDGTAELLLTNVVSDNFFSVLGVRPLIGRVFTSRDAQWLRTHPVVVLGNSCWHRDFGGDPNIVGRSITLLRGKDHRYQVDVWGVLPPSFREIDPGSDRDLWMPSQVWAFMGRADELRSHEFRWFRLLGRLAPGATVREADSQAAGIASVLAVADPADNHDRGARVISDFSYRMSQAGMTGLVLFAIVAGVVLLAVVNVAHLLFSRVLSRAPEISLRLSLGATRWVIARQLLIENLLLVALSLVLALGLAVGLAAVLPRFLVLQPVMLESFGSGLHLRVDFRVFVFASALALITALLLALIPLSRSARPELLPKLNAGSSSCTAAQVPLLRRAAIWLQIGVSFALLASMGVLVRSFVNTRTESIGLTRKQVLVAFTQGPGTAIRNEVIANLGALPGVQKVAYGIRAPLMPSEGGIATRVIFPGRPELREPIAIKYNAVSPGFLDVTGTRIVRGRGFTAVDDLTGPPVVIISQAMAQKYWPDQNPIGQSVRLPDFGNGIRRGSPLEARIIGVAENAPINQIGEIPEPYIYIPFRLSQMGEITFVVETRQNAMSIARDAREALIRINPLLDPMFITSLPELIRSSSGSYQMMAELASALGLIGLVLTVVGLYGFLSFRVTQRTREIGIRMALGASREATVRLIARDIARMAGMGLAIGLVLALAAARLEAALVFDVRPLDALSLASALGILAIAVLAAAWLPARRAAAVDPMKALRSE
jgi:putative ABC transport system permease protein